MFFFGREASREFRDRLLDKNVAREEDQMSAWPRQPRALKAPPGYALYGCQRQVSSNQSLLPGTAAKMKRRDSAS